VVVVASPQSLLSTANVAADPGEAARVALARTAQAHVDRFDIKKDP